MRRTKALQERNWFLNGAMALVLAVLMGLFVNGFSIVSSAAEQGKVTAASGAKIRAEAASSSEMVGSAAKDKTVTINSSVQGNDGYTWYQVTVDNVSGYIRSDLIQKDGEGSTSTPAATNETPAEVAKVNPVSATVTGSQSVRIRSNASTTSQIVTTASSGLVLTVTGQATGSDGKTWYQVSFTSNGAAVEGFIRSDYVNLSEELTPYTEEPVAPETPAETPAEPETPAETTEKKPYETVQQNGEWYLVVTESNQGYAIQDIFDKMTSNAEEYAKLEKKVKSDKVVIIILVILLVGAAGGATFLFFRMKDMADAKYFNEVEKETLRRREPARQGGQKVMHTVGAEKGGARPAGARPAGGTRPAGAKPAGGTRHAGTAPAGAKPAGGTRPAGAAPAGAKPAGNARPAGAPQTGTKPAGALKQASKSGNAQQGWQSKNFMAEDDDEFEFEFLNYDGEEEE